MRLLVLSLFFLLAGSAHAQTEPLRAYEPDTTADLPPWPGPMPTQFADEAAYAQTLQSRLEQINVRAERLTELGRPPRTRHKLAGWMTIGAGLTIGAVGLVATDDPRNDRAFRAWMGVCITGGLIAFTGFAILLSAPRNPYRGEIRDLQREGEALKRELRRLKWERVQTEVNLSANGVALTAKF